MAIVITPKLIAEASLLGMGLDLFGLPLAGA